QLRSLGRWARMLGPKLAPDDAASVLESAYKLFAASTKDQRAFQAFAEATTALDVKLTEVQTRGVLQAALDSLASSATTASQLLSIATALAVVAPKLPTGQVEDVFAKIVGVLSKTTNPMVVRGVG